MSVLAPVTKILEPALDLPYIKGLILFLPEAILLFKQELPTVLLLPYLRLSSINRP